MPGMRLTAPVWLRALLFILVVPGTVAGWLPWYIAGSPPFTISDGRPLRGLGVLLVLVGWGVLLACARDFARSGRGTPAPYDPPRALVTNGLYRFVRNPMYVGVLAAIVGHTFWYYSKGVALYAVAVAVMVHLRVVMHEEPWLMRTFGPEFAAYRARVPRWLPRVRQIRRPRDA